MPSNYAQFNSRSHQAVIRVYDDAGIVIETHERTAVIALGFHQRDQCTGLAHQKLAGRLMRAHLRGFVPCARRYAPGPRFFARLRRAFGPTTRWE
jgi:hypothetical protein